MCSYSCTTVSVNIVIYKPLQVCKEDINSFSSRRRLFPCQMSVRWIGVEGRNTTPLIYKILMKGATDKHNFLTITSDLPLGIGTVIPVKLIFMHYVCMMGL